nr:uncharacterized protein ymae [Quercus suber]
MDIPLQTSNDLLVCNACGTQFSSLRDSGKDDCRICDDPRQYVPAAGQTFTTLAQLREEGYKNVWWQDEEDSRIWCVQTEPKVPINKRARQEL